MSHDFRSPLTAILTAAGALAHAEIVLDDADRQELAETIIAETLRLDRLVGDLLDLSRLEEVQAADGRLDLSLQESLPGQGAAFVLALPLAVV